MESKKTIRLPAHTSSPIILAFGITLVFLGLVTSLSISLLGAIIAIYGGAGWLSDILPVQEHESVPILGEPPAVATTRRQVARIAVARGLKRARLPLEIYPVSAG